MRGLPLLVLMVGCAGSHPSDRPLIGDCEAAFVDARQGDPCALTGECGAASRDGATRDAAVCDSGALLRSRIEERVEGSVGPCPGTLDEESDTFLSLTPAELGCVDATFCTELLGGGVSLRRAHVCELGPVEAARDGVTHGDCATAVAEGDDGDACAGAFACIADRELAPGEFLPILGWCDGGVLRLAATQTLIHGGP
ncbi:MAG: hypothetical protein H6719_15060 [Sandaracinaceae bacterium]|nr:hypothetical protein [Sandaracinaceae bacterium]